MIVAILVIGYVLVLRYLDQQNKKRDRIKMGIEGPAAPVDYATLRQSLLEISERLTSVEMQYRELAQRLGVTP